MFRILKQRLFYYVFLSVFSILSIVSVKFDTSLSYQFLSLFLRSTTYIRQGMAFVSHKAQDVSQFFTSHAKQREKIAGLEKQIQSYEKNFKSVESLQYQVTRLQELLNFALYEDYQLLPAFVFAQDTTRYQRYVLSRGRKDGVLKDSPVFAIHQRRLVLLGRIKDVQTDSSLFIPTNDSDFIVPAISGTTKQIGLAYGNNDLAYTMSFELNSISGIEQLFVNEEILVNDFSKNYPVGIPIGRITDITLNQEDLLLLATVKPYVDIKSIDIAFIYMAQ